MTYIYPVISRRAQGVSIGVNLNPNNKCNWRCTYCQVPNLSFGKGPTIDLGLLERELDEMLAAIFEGDYLERHVPDGSQRVNDIALSGNGEPTSSSQFEEAIDTVLEVLSRREATRGQKIVLITNGSLLHHDSIRKGLGKLGAANGEVWFKLDSATADGLKRMNGAHIDPDRVAHNLRLCAELCPTWLQTMMLRREGRDPSEEEIGAYTAFLGERLREGVPLRGILLYGLARKSYQPEAATLAPLPATWMRALRDRLGQTGLEVRLSL